MEIRRPKRTAWEYLHPFRRAIAMYALCPSETKPQKLYTVIKRANIFGSRWTCDCADYHFREHECKHIKKMKLQLTTLQPQTA